jgi:hypothetical protein
VVLANDLRHQVTGPVLSASDADFATECAGFDLSAVPRPELVVGAATTDDIVTALRFAVDRGMPVTVRATGHGATAIVDEGLLVTTRRVDAVHVDPAARIARLSAGTTWDQVIRAAAEHGLAPLCGAASGIGAVSFTLGGGLSPLGRSHGFAADHVRRIAVVTADGTPRVVRSDQEPDLFWALRGGGGNFGIVTELDIELFPVRELYGGGLFFPGAATPDVLTAFVAALPSVPDELSLSVAVLTFPDMPGLPPQVRGRHCCHVRVASTGTPDAVDRHIDRLRQAGPLLLDTVDVLPFTAVASIHLDPTSPLPVRSRALVLRSADEGLVRTLAAHTGPDAGSMVELRHLGGALARPPEVPNPVGHRDGLLNLFVSATPDAPDTVAGDQDRLLTELRPWSDGGALYTFLAGPHVTAADTAAAFSPGHYRSLTELKSTWDPDNVFRFNGHLAPHR